MSSVSRLLFPTLTRNRLNSDQGVVQEGGLMDGMMDDPLMQEYVVIREVSYRQHANGSPFRYVPLASNTPLPRKEVRCTES